MAAVLGMLTVAELVSIGVALINVSPAAAKAIEDIVAKIHGQGVASSAPVPVEHLADVANAMHDAADRVAAAVPGNFMESRSQGAPL